MSRLISIGVFFLCFHVAMIVVNGLGIFGISFDANNDVLNAAGRDQLSELDYSQSAVSTTSNFGIGDFVKSLFYLVLLFGKIIFVFPWTFIQFGVPVWMALIVSTPVYAMYMYLIAQWVGNRGEKSMG